MYTSMEKIGITSFAMLAYIHKGITYRAIGIAEDHATAIHNALLKLQHEINIITIKALNTK